MKHKDIHDYLMLFEGILLDFPFGEDKAVYRIAQDFEEGPGKMVALIEEGSIPLRLSLRCDPMLAVKLREDYETVLPGKNLNKKTWNTIVCTGQVPDDELKSLISISYNLAKSE